ncbi:MAG: hypothetical protein ACRDL6_00210 [Solirubrobacterales bacterium]
MPNIIPTHITTDSPGSGELNLNDGFPIFGWLGTLRAGTNLNSATGTFLDKSVNFEFLKIYTGIFHSAFIGICGPSWAFEADTDASTSYVIPPVGQPGSGTLVLGDHDIRGGFQYGIDFEIDFDVEVDLNLVFTKKKLIDFDAGIDINVIDLIIDLIEYLLEGGGGGQAEGNPNDLEMSTFHSDSDGSESIDEGQNTSTSKGGPKTGKAKPEFAGTGMVDFVNDPWLQPPGKTVQGAPSNKIIPQLGFNFSIVPLFADIPFLDVIYGFNEALSEVGGSFGFGPGLAVGFPVTVTLDGATIDNHPFNVTSATASGSGNTNTTLPLVEQSPVSPNLQPLKQTPDEIGLMFSHIVGIELELYFFIELTFLEVFHIGAQTGDIPLATDPEIPGGAGGPWHNQLSFIPGGGEVPFGPPTTAPTVGPYTANQPQGRWKNGILARYGISFFDDNYESPIGPFSAFDPEQRFFAFPQLSDIEAPLSADDSIKGRNVYRQFNDGSEPELVGTINDDTTTTFLDDKP